ncbi:MAG: hypothetical protein WAW96_01610 [Alphaproteobacteria bacterium]
MAGLVTAGFAFASHAEAVVYDGMTQAQVEAALTSGGKTFKKIDTNIWALEQGRHLILTSCPDRSNATCYEIYIIDKFSNVRPTLQGVNKWNSDSRAPEASVSDQGFLELTMFVSTVGITEKLLLDTLMWLDTAEQLESFNSFWRPYLVSPGA